MTSCQLCLGDIIGVYLNMDMNTLKFSVNGADHGAAFDSIDLNEKDDINGYRLAISLQHRPHKLTLLESTLYNVERRSPRPNNNTFGNGGGHQRKLSYTTMSNNKRKGTAGTISDDAKSDEHLTPKPAAKSSKKKKKKSSKKSDPLDSNLSPSKIKKKGKGKKKKSISDKDSTTASSKKAKGKKKKSKTTSTSTASKKKSKKAKDATTTASKKKKKKTKTKKSKKNDEEEEKKENDASKKKKSSKKSADGTAWVKRESAKKDKWDECGSKLNIEKSSVSTKTNIKDGNSSFGKLSVKGNKMKIEWVVTIKHGDNIGLGICNVTGGLKTNKNKKLLTKSFTNAMGGYGYMGNDGGSKSGTI